MNRTELDAEIAELQEKEKVLRVERVKWRRREQKAQDERYCDLCNRDRMVLTEERCSHCEDDEDMDDRALKRLQHTDNALRAVFREIDCWRYEIVRIMLHEGASAASIKEYCDENNFDDEIDDD